MERAGISRSGPLIISSINPGINKSPPSFQKTDRNIAGDARTVAIHKCGEYFGYFFLELGKGLVKKMVEKFLQLFFDVEKDWLKRKIMLDKWLGS